MQSFIRGRYRSFVGETVAGFYVHDIASQVRPNRDGSPNYDCRCLRCNQYFVKRQAELNNGANGARIFCGNHTCSASRVEHPQLASLADLRKSEAQERAARGREKKKREAEMQNRAESERAEQEEKSKWRVFATSLFNAGVRLDSPEWVSFERWRCWSVEFRADMLARIEQG